ncbi:putative inorganic phosphate cotransporter isoform X1 [Eupeodes corollae]|uniref:putative inorganic phosphate cotransporter isoform X1 n=1 Tax=Eupeodes corollae TaxID=290404 RepID=UPI0024902151|nr:putative inorganic phosphate cotransporter isoform X1 [Eupeodes corollae]
MVVDEKYKGPLLGARHLQAILINLAMLTSYLQRVNISVTLIAMTDSKTTNPYFHEFDWNEKERSYIISSFFWGYILTQFPGGFMSRKLGVKATIMIAMLGSSVLNLLISVSVPWGQWQVYCVIRFGQGLFQGLVFPSAHTHLAMWSPVEERTLLGGLSHLGVETGTVFAMCLTGIIAASDLGWPGISYVYGGFGIGFCVIWMIFAENSPSVARFITADERKYIISSQAGTGGETKPTVPIPWKAIFTSVPFISLLVVRIGHNWGSSTMQTQTPAYLHGVLSMSIVSNAFYSSLPHLAAWILSFVYFTIAELVLQKKWASLSVVRKTINTISMWIPALLLIGIGFLDEKQKALAIVLLTLNEGLNSGNTVGSLLNLIDLSPNHTAILTAVLNCITNIIPMITPLVVGIIVYDETQRTLWQIVFVIASAFFFFGNLQYLFFAATNVQPWNDGEFLTKNDNKQKI